jgi:hypothetical protein
MIGIYDIGVLDKLKSVREELKKRKEINTPLHDAKTTSTQIVNLRKGALIACSNIRLSE